MRDKIQLPVGGKKEAENRGKKRSREQVCFLSKGDSFSRVYLVASSWYPTQVSFLVGASLPKLLQEPFDSNSQMPTPLSRELHHPSH